MKMIFIIIAMLAVSVVHADTLNWSWDAPTTRTDGTPFDMTNDGAGYQIMFNGVLEMDGSGNPLLLSPGANGLSKDFPAGDVCIQVATQDTDGRLSTFTDAVNDSSQTACKGVLAPPGQVTNITVTITVVP